MANIIIGAIVILAMGFAIKSIIKSKKSGECSCGGSCKSCGVHCHDLHNK